MFIYEVSIFVVKFAEKKKTNSNNKEE
jgi:hypothetical protein